MLRLKLILGEPYLQTERLKMKFQRICLRYIMKMSLMLSIQNRARK